MIIIQPVAHSPHPKSEDLVRELRKAADPGETILVLRAYGSIGVDRVRSQLVSCAMRARPRHEEFLLVDADLWTTIDGVRMLRDSMRRTGALFMCAPAVCRGTHDLNIRPMCPGEIVLGPSGGVIEVAKGNVACTIIHRRAFELVGQTLPDVDFEDVLTGEMISGKPYFWPLVRVRTEYGEDYSFALRLRDAGVRLYCDTRVPTWHSVEEELGVDRARGVQERNPE